MDDFFYIKKAFELSSLAPGGRNFRVGAVIMNNNEQLLLIENLWARIKESTN